MSENKDVLNIIQNALIEDIGSGDHSSLSSIDEHRKAKAVLIFKESGVVAGLNIAIKILKINDPDCIINVFKSDGDSVNLMDIGFEVEGNARALLRSERLLLNIMQRLSGIATITKRVSNKINHYHTKVLDTRKTTPNLRILEKWAVTVGGGYNHRIGLYDMIMLKDNHVDVAGGIIKAIQLAKDYLTKNNLNLGIEIETRNLEEVKQALTMLPIQRIMFDNFSPELTQKAVELVDGKCETESSGGITIENIEDYAKTGVDFISLGMLTHSVKSLDISFKIKLT
ncbi:MAG: carboxylating nicotinate-nucleotide diphosphorylase [Bacteroidota bacterium]|nr:carboxylating nicotinate-nucleotide diphosphorylase [Bacteroidota bacterium]